MSQATNAFVENNKTRLLDELKTFLRIPSVSTLPEHFPDVRRAAEFVAQSMRIAGLENIEIIPTAKHPLVYADWLHAPGKPTVLCYGHYDVQPPDPLDEWVTPPFEPTIRNGNLYARGSADDKGQMYMHIKAVEALRSATGTLPVNLKFLIEGEEECGGEGIAAYLPANKAKLKADVALYGRVDPLRTIRGLSAGTARTLWPGRRLFRPWVTILSPGFTRPSATASVSAIGTAGYTRVLSVSASLERAALIGDRGRYLIRLHNDRARKFYGLINIGE